MSAPHNFKGMFEDSRTVFGSGVSGTAGTAGVRGQESGGGAGWIMSTKYPLGLRWFYCSNLFCLHLLGSYEGSFIKVFLF